MKTPTHFVRAMGIAVILTLSHSACSNSGSNDDPTEPRLIGISVAPSSLTIDVGASDTLVVQGSFDDGSTRPLDSGLTFTSSADRVAFVDMAGVVTGSGEGTARITVTFEALMATANVTVRSPPPRALPMIVDDAFNGRAGFGEGGPSFHSEDDMCPERAGAQSGGCHRFTWDGTGGAFTGALWIRRANPAATNPFDDINPVAVQPGATGITFWAWGAAGGEVIGFGAGLGNAESGEPGNVRTPITLTTTPTQYTVSLTSFGPYTEVLAAFAVSLSARRNPSGATFYVDDIQWTQGIPPTPISLPMAVDDNFTRRAAFGDGGPPLHTEDAMCPERAGERSGVCHRFVWDGTGGTFTGGFWIRRSNFTDPNPFDDINPVAVDPGAGAITFWAWGAAGGEVIEFGAGLNNPDLGDPKRIRRNITLSTTPTQYTVSLASYGPYTDVSAPFLVAIVSAANPNGATIYIDDIQWVSAATETAIPLPMTVDDNFTGRAGFGDGGPPFHTEDVECPMRAGGQNGLCHRFIWDGTGGLFTGAFWINGTGFDNLNGLRVEEGATDISFWAWGAAGGESVIFGAGLDDGNEGNTMSSVVLTNTPTRYTVPLAPFGPYTEVRGAFFVTLEGGAVNPMGATIFVDDIQWIRN